MLIHKSNVIDTWNCVYWMGNFGLKILLTSLSIVAEIIVYEKGISAGHVMVPEVLTSMSTVAAPGRGQNRPSDLLIPECLWQA